MRRSGNGVEVQVELRYGGPLSDLEPSGPRLDGRDNGTPQAKKGKENSKVEFEGRQLILCIKKELSKREREQE
jgi:hypothetical protein